MIIIKESSPTIGPTEPARVYIVLNRCATRDEVEAAERDGTIIVLNVLDEEHAAKEGLHARSTLEDVQAWVRRHGVEPSNYHVLAIATDGALAEQAAREWVDRWEIALGPGFLGRKEACFA